MSPHPTRRAGSPDSVAAVAEHRVNLLIPFVHVEDVERSIAFYHHLGLPSPRGRVYGLSL